MRLLLLTTALYLLPVSARAAPLSAPALHWVRGPGADACIAPRALFALLSGPRTGLGSNDDGLAGVLWFDGDGNQTGVILIAGSEDHTPRMLGLANERVALAALYSTSDDIERPQGKVRDVYVSRLSKDGSAEVQRIRGESPVALTIAGFAKDPDDNLYVSSVTGTRGDPRGIVCMLPTSGDAECFFAPPGVFPTLMAVPSPGVIYAHAGSELVRLELP